jgi:hypothetical protein
MIEVETLTKRWCIGIFVIFLAVSLSLYRKANA